LFEILIRLHIAQADFQCAY